jgi:DNA-binding HxlR family transcriptional regulator
MGNSAGKVQHIRTCSIWRALEIFGDAPTLLILQSYWLGARRFDDFCRSTGLLKTVVSGRLKKLIQNHCLVKVAYRERPKRYEYHATEELLDLFPTALAMLHWERQWGSTKGKVDIRVTHSACGELTDPHPACASCGGEVHARDVSWEPGPGIGEMPAIYSRRRRQTSQSTGEATELLDDITQLIGDRWSALILRSVFTGLNQFQEILDNTAVSTNILADRLAELCDGGVLYRVEEPKDMRRANYRLTDKGRDIYPILITLMQWGDRWRPAPEGPPLVLTHRPCNESLEIVMACSCCDERVDPRDTSVEVFRKDERLVIGARRRP